MRMKQQHANVDQFAGSDADRVNAKNFSRVAAEDQLEQPVVPNDLVARGFPIRAVPTS